MSKHLIAPSLLAADFGELRKASEMLNASEADWFHLDVMDGVFVPNISFGLPVIKAFNRLTDKPLDVHLMIVNPDNFLEAFRDAGADVITVHYEACSHLHRTLSKIRGLGAKAGVALNPHTPASLLRDVAHELDLVCVMSVNPGFGGQSFIENTYSKVRDLVRLRAETNASFLIEIDGGVKDENASALLQAGADVLVAGSFVFKSENPSKTISNLKALDSLYSA